MSDQEPPTEQAVEQSSRRCSSCFNEGLEPGFLEDQGQGARGNLRWIPGSLEKGIFGGARRMGKQRHDVHALRCPTCGRLELFVDGA